mgnify:CR=1 FL=1
MPPLEVGRPQPTRRHVRENVRLLDDLLSRAILHLDGQEVADVVTEMRAGKLALADLGEDDALILARALACHALLGNIGEEVAGRRRHAEAELEPYDGPPRTLRRAVENLRQEGLAPAEIAAALTAVTISPVLTAHPTEIRRRAVLAREAAITRLMALRRHRLPGDLDRRLEEDLFREVALLWRTRLHRPERITVADEIRNTAAMVRDSILGATEELYADWEDLLPAESRPLQLGSWLGGDRDGHPGVDGTTLMLALQTQARIILNRYSDEVRKLWSELAVSSKLAATGSALNTLAEASPDLSPHRRDEPFRLALETIWDRLSATANRLAGGTWPAKGEPYPEPRAFTADLEIVRDALIEGGGQALVGGRLRSLIQLSRVCGFHILSIDLRQNAEVHERTISELLGAVTAEADYLSLDEAGRVRLLLAELSHARPLRSPFAAYSDETRRELAIMDAAAKAARLYGPGALGSYIVSKAASVSDLLEPLVLMKEAGLGGASPTLGVSPLFETIPDLENASGIIADWLDLHGARAMPGGRAVQEFVLGYSDSNKDGGYLA